MTGFQQALLQRLRFEQALGLETVRPVPLAPRVASRPQASAVLRPSATAGGGGATLPASAEPATARSAPLLAGSAGVPTRPQETDADIRAPDKVGTELFSVEQEVTGLGPQELAARWTALETQVRGCARCPLHQHRTHTVFGEGDRQARLVFVGEGPGADEDRTGRPFVGRAGQLLDKMIAAMGFKREDVFICNVVKCRPPENRTPLEEEVSCCWPYLEEQLALLKPQVIVALGSPAAKTLLKTSQGINALRGRWHLYRGVRVMPTFHPAFVLRQYTPAVRTQVWADMQMVMKYLKELKDSQ